MDFIGKIRESYNEKIDLKMARMFANHIMMLQAKQGLTYETVGDLFGKYAEQLLKQKEESVLDFIADNEGWEEKRDYYAEKLGVKLRYKSITNK